MMAADDFKEIARRMAEIRAERERHSGVLNAPLPSVAIDLGKVEEVPESGDHIDCYAYF